MAKANEKHPQYIAISPIWSLCRDAIAGQVKIKAAGIRYLPDFEPPDPARYAAYLLRAYYMNITGRTLESMTGMVFRKPATAVLTPRIEDLAVNIDGAGQSLEQVAKQATQSLLAVGRHALFVDYPRADAGIDAETEAQLGLRPTITTYSAESIINWKHEVINGRSMLTLAVLEEAKDASKSEFSHETTASYRVLRLREGIYTQQMYDDKGEPAGEEYAPTMAGGGFFDHIPLHIAGSSNNLPDADMPPLYDMAIINVAHYQTTADHRENLFIHGQLTIGITTDLSPDEFKRANPNGVYVGARNGHFLGSNGTFHSVTAPESSSLRVALQDLEAQMVAIGARLVQAGGVTETATAARINASAEASTLDTIVDNLSECIEASLEDMALFIGENPDAIEFKLNKDFWENGLDPNVLSAIIGAGTAGVIAKSDQLHMIRMGKIEIRDGRTDEEIQQEVADGLLDQ